MLASGNGASQTQDQLRGRELRELQAAGPGPCLGGTVHHPPLQAPGARPDGDPATASCESHRRQLAPAPLPTTTSIGAPREQGAPHKRHSTVHRALKCLMAAPERTLPPPLSRQPASASTMESVASRRRTRSLTAASQLRLLQLPDACLALVMSYACEGVPWRER